MPTSMPSDAAMKDQVSELERALDTTPGVYEVMRLYEQYRKVLDQCRPYLVTQSRSFLSASSSDRTG